MTKKGGLYRHVRINFWTDPDFFTLEPLQKLFMLYLETGPRTNMIGVYVLPLSDAEEDVGVDKGDLTKWVTGVLAPHVSYDFRTREIFVHEMARQQVDDTLKANDNRLKNVRKQLDGVHSAALRDAFLTRYHDWPLHVREEAPSKPLPSPSKGASGKGGSPFQAPSRSPFEARGSSSSRTGTETTNGDLNQIGELLNSEQLPAQTKSILALVQEQGLKPPPKLEE